MQDRIMQDRKIPNTIIAIAGTARSGKDTTAVFIRNFTGCYIDHWARKLKEIARELTTTYPVSPELPWYRKIFYKLSGVGGKELSFWDGSDETKRKPCVSLGAGLRNNLHQGVWIDALLYSLPVEAIKEKGIVIPDTRYANEVEQLKLFAEYNGMDFKLVYIVNVDAPPQGEEAEKTVPLIKQANFVIDNSDMSPILLKKRVGEVLDRIIARKENNVT